jgi:hypothetical protein
MLPLEIIDSLSIDMQDSIVARCSGNIEFRTEEYQTVEGMLN